MHKHGGIDSHERVGSPSYSPQPYTPICEPNERSDNPTAGLLMFGHTLLFLIIGAGVGIGTVVIKVGITNVNPVVFAFMRNAFAAVLMLVPVMLFEKNNAWFRRDHIPRILVCGFLLFGTNFFFTVGLKISSSVIGAAWQCVIPIFTSLFAILLGREKITVTKAFGFIVACSGALCIIMLGNPSRSVSSTSRSSNFLLGNICFFLNTTALALYGICTKPLMEHYPNSSFTITTVSFCVCAVIMLVMVPLTSYVHSVHELLCETCVDSGADWTIPISAVAGLVVMVIVFSILQYGVINWTNRFIDTSKINAYNTLQPLFASASVAVLVGFGFNSSHSQNQLVMPGANSIGGGLGIILGLFLVLAEDFFESANGDKEDVEKNEASISTSTFQLAVVL